MHLMNAYARADVIQSLLGRSTPDIPCTVLYCQSILHYINIFYLCTLQTLPPRAPPPPASNRIDAFSLQPRDVLLTVLHNHLDQRRAIDKESSIVFVRVVGFLYCVININKPLHPGCVWLFLRSIVGCYYKQRFMANHINGRKWKGENS